MYENTASNCQQIVIRDSSVNEIRISFAIFRDSQATSYFHSNLIWRNNWLNTTHHIEGRGQPHTPQNTKFINVYSHFQHLSY